MMFCQLAYARSLREICGGLAALEGKLRHLGVMDCPTGAEMFNVPELDGLQRISTAAA